jgi:hypothetical protein
MSSGRLAIVPIASKETSDRTTIDPHDAHTAQTVTEERNRNSAPQDGQIVASVTVVRVACGYR